MGSTPGARQLPPFLPCPLCPLKASLWPLHRYRSAGGSVVTLYPVAGLGMSSGTRQGNGVCGERALHPKYSPCSWARPHCLPLLCTAETMENLRRKSLRTISGELGRPRSLSVRLSLRKAAVPWQCCRNRGYRPGCATCGSHC